MIDARAPGVVEQVGSAIEQLKVGDPQKEDTQIGCLISEKAAIKVEKEVQLTLEQGGKLLLGGKRNGAYYEPTVITDIPKTADVAKDMEIFGPVVSIIGWRKVSWSGRIASGGRLLASTDWPDTSV